MAALSGLIAKGLLKKIHPLVFFFVGQLYILPLMFAALFLLGGFPAVTLRFYEIIPRNRGRIGDGPQVS